MKHLLIVLALSMCPDARAHIVMSSRPMLADDLVLGYPRPMPVQGHPRYPSEEAWRRGHSEIPDYAPYTPDYGPYFEGRSYRFQGTRNPYYREEDPSVDYSRVYRRWRRY